MHTDETTAPPPYSVMIQPLYELPKSSTSSPDRDATIDRFFVTHTIFVTFFTTPFIAFAPFAPLKVILTFYVFIIMAAAWSRNVCILKIVVVLAVLEIVAAFGAFYVVLDPQVGEYVRIDPDVVIAAKQFLALFILLYILMAVSQLYLAYELLLIEESARYRVFVAARVSR